MTIIKATVTGRRLDIDIPPDWPDGTEVEIRPMTNGKAGDHAMPEEEITKLLAIMDQIEPLEISDAERAAWEAEQQAHKNSEKSEFADQAAKLKRMWE